jgi:acetylornithine deacetylase
MHIAKDIDQWINKNEEEIINSISEFIRVRTENTPPSGNEKRGQEWLFNKLEGFLKKDEIDVFEIDDIDGIRKNPLFFPTIDGVERIYKDRPNLVAKIKGKNSKKSIAFSGHIDTMPAGEGSWKIFDDPFSGKVKDGKIYGRGAADMKAGTLCGFLALKCLKDLQIELAGDVFAESIVDEENGGVNGSLAARLRNPGIDFAIVAEPSNLSVGISTRGGTDWKVSVQEQSLGGITFDSVPPNPIFKLSKVALALKKYDFEKNKEIKAKYKDVDYLPLLVYQICSGGSTYDESGYVPTQGHIYFWQETLAHTKEDEAKKELLSFLRKELEGDAEFKENFPEIKPVLRFLEGHMTDRNHPAMASLKKAFDDFHLAYKEEGVNFATDAFIFKKATGTEVVVFGPVGANLHGKDEFVEIESVKKVIKVMALTAIDYCG